MKYLSILTIISTPTVWSTAIEPTQPVDITSEDTADITVSFGVTSDPIDSTTVAPANPTTPIPSDCKCPSLACARNINWRYYGPALQRLINIERAVLGYRPADPLLYPFMSGANRRNDYWPGHGFLNLERHIAQTNDGKLFVAEVNPGVEATTVAPLPQAKRRRTANTDTATIEPETTELTAPAKRVVVKYSTNCDDPRISPLVKEFVIRSFINQTSISPKVYYISPAIRMTPANLPLTTSRFMGSYLEDNLDECARNGTSIRFMVQEEAGPALDTFAHHHLHNGTPAFAKMILQIGRRLLSMLENLHSVGIVHGDVHAGNIVYNKSVGHVRDIDSIEFALIDFEYSFYFPNKFGQPVDGVDNSNLTPRYLSPWQLAGQRMGPRDDVYRLLYVIGDILSKGRHHKGIARILESNLDLFGAGTDHYDDAYTNIAFQVEMYAKKHFFLFRHSVELGSQAVTGLPEDLEATVTEKLEAMHMHVVNTYSHPDMKIDYAFIRATLNEVIALFP